jgi:putative hydrolase of the HAD superfamily
VSAVIRPEALATIDAAKRAGCKLAILSNELDLFYGAGFRDRLPCLAGFDLIVDATYTDILKPDPRAYALVTDGLGVAAQDCVFVDDQPRNVWGGQAAGMRTVAFDVKKPSASFGRALDLLGVSQNLEACHDVA